MFHLATSGTSRLPAVAILLLQHTSFSSGASLNCYFPNGTFAPNRYPCYPTEAESYCCPLTYACLDNKLCKSLPSSNTHFGSLRGSCTDSSFEDDACPKFCTKADNKPQKEAIVFGCPQGNNTYCCEGDPCQHAGDNDGVGCPTGNATATFSLIGEGIIQTVIGATPSSTALPISATASIPTTATSTSESTTPTAQPPLSLPLATVTAEPQSSSSSASAKKATAIGAGVGIPVGVIAIAGIGFIFWRRERRRKSGVAVDGVKRQELGDGKEGDGYGYEREGLAEMPVREEAGYELGGGGGVIPRAEMEGEGRGQKIS